eukprot:GHVS01044504.1.p1 GENE.GHVS01044504.1~~GHVS01044504.1.p1  ORF type:complete len:298 (-),score=36.39 GHVS01044504.1:43-912(-)
MSKTFWLTAWYILFVLQPVSLQPTSQQSLWCGLSLPDHSPRSPTPSSSVCKADTGGTCAIFPCGKWRGPTDCKDRRCWCKPGYCDVLGNGLCSGCDHLSVTVEGVPEQADKTGTYSAIATYFYSNRPVWKQEVYSTSWLWYCPLFSYWVITADSPTTSTNCSAGIVSPQSNQTLSPLDLFNTTNHFPDHKGQSLLERIDRWIQWLNPFGPCEESSAAQEEVYSGHRSWRYWDGSKWVDDENGTRIHIRCQDKPSNPVQVKEKDTRRAFNWREEGGAELSRVKAGYKTFS